MTFMTVRVNIMKSLIYKFIDINPADRDDGIIRNNFI